MKLHNVRVLELLQNGNLALQLVQAVLGCDRAITLHKAALAAQPLLREALHGIELLIGCAACKADSAIGALSNLLEKVVLVDLLLVLEVAMVVVREFVVKRGRIEDKGS